MSKYTDHLWQDLAREHGSTLAHDERPEPARAGVARFMRRPRILAGGSLGLAGGVTALVLALSAGGAAAPAAFAVTTTAGGGVLVHLDYVSGQDLPQVNQKLATMGTGEQIGIQMGAGPASSAGAVTCSAAPSGPTIKVLVGSDGTEVIAAGQSAGNTAEGSFHLVSCDASTAGSGNTGS